LNGLRRAFGFFTILPFARAGSIEETARAIYFLPLVAACLGGVEGLAGWGSMRLFGQPVGAAIIMATALLLTGLHHADGLADLGDALMVHGDAARRIEVLKDRTMGIGAAGALILTYLISWTALLQLAAWNGEGARLVWCLMAVEISARLSLFTVFAAGGPSHAGSGSIFLETAKGWRIAVGIFLSLAGLAALALALPAMGVVAAGGAAAATGLALAAVGKHWFGGAGGDIMGAAVELGRMTALLGLVAVLLPAAAS